jgi:hypothetical protein
VQKQDVIIVDCIRKENNFGLAKQAGLVRAGVGNAYNPESGTIEEIYHTRKIKFENADLAVVFFKAVFNDYIKPLNSDKRLGSMVKSFPFSPENTTIQITFIDPHGIPVTAPHIARIRNEEGKILLFSYDSETGRYRMLSEGSF